MLSSLPCLYAFADVLSLHLVTFFNVLIFVVIRNVSFISNEKYGRIHSAIIALYYANHVTFTDCKVHGNEVLLLVHTRALSM